MKGTAAELWMIDQPQGNDGLGNVNATHGNCGIEWLITLKTGVTEYLGGVEHSDVDTGKLLGEHHHDSDEQGPFKGTSEQLRNSDLGLMTGMVGFFLDSIQLYTDITLSSQLFQILLSLFSLSLVDQVVLGRFWAKGESDQLEDTWDYGKG